jgi:hypothetical protein
MKKDDVQKEIINAMLKKYNVDIEYVYKNPIIEGQPWYQYYTMSTEEHKVWSEWAIKLIRKRLRYNKKRAEQSFAMLDLYCGLKIKDDDDTTG